MPPRIYFDLCALKRGWDDLGQPRIRAEADAVDGLLQRVRSGILVFIHSPVHHLENDRNTDPQRYTAVRELLLGFPLIETDLSRLRVRASSLVQSGLSVADALHVAAALAADAEYFVTTDDRLIRQCARVQSGLSARSPVQCLLEVGLP